MFDSRVLTQRHSTRDTTVPVSRSIHHLICVTLKDGTTWAVDPAGAQHGQIQPALPFDKYMHGFVAKVLARRPYGSGKEHLDTFTSERHPREEFIESAFIKLGFIMRHVVDELEEWQFKHASIKDIIKANASDYSSLKAMLVAHLVTVTREFIKLSKGDLTSTTKLIDTNSKSPDLTEEDKQRIKRKRDRQMASRDSRVAERMNSQWAQEIEALLR